ncbi:MAG: EVE domain-containing protein [Fimbriimonadaceae bacterium]
MNYWLMKSEPATYSVDDLARKRKPDIWEGCRNYTVRNFFRDKMKAGDLSFFYHSSCPEPGIVGVMRIVGEAYADPTQFEPKSSYFDAKSPKDNPRWLARDVELVEKFDRVIQLAELRETPGLEGMEVLKRGQRLSVLPVTAEEWAIVARLAGFQNPA